MSEQTDFTAVVLKACPFCGEDELPHLLPEDRDGNYDPRGNVICGGCGAQSPIRDAAGQRADASERWNTRAAIEATPLKECVTALKEIAALGDGRKLNWGDAQDAIDTARAALSQVSALTEEGGV